MSESFVEGDTGSRLRVTCTSSDNKLPIQLFGATVRLRWTRPGGGPVVTKTMTIVDEAGGIAEYQFDADELEPGLMSFEVEIEDSLGRIISSLSLLREQVRRQLG